MSIVYRDFLVESKMINQQVYKEILRQILRSVPEKKRKFWCGELSLLSHDNAITHKRWLIRQFLTERNMAILRTTCSPDIAPFDLFLFSKLKIRFEDVETINWTVMTELRATQ